MCWEFDLQCGDVEGDASFKRWELMRDSQAIGDSEVFKVTNLATYCS